MKSIFRKIAFVLALAMVVTLFPVMSASAATKDNKYVRTKNATLFVGGDVNGSYENCWATGKKAKELVKKSGYKSTYTTDDEEGKIISISKYGFVEAVGVGKATVTVTFTKKGEKDIVESFDVTVKKNAVNVAFEEEVQKKLTEGLTVGDKLTLKAVQTDADGKNDVTDAAKFTVKNPEGEGNEVVTLDTKTGELTAVKAGKATVTVRSWQWAWDSTLKKNVSTPTNEEVSVEVEVKEALPTITASKQDSSRQLTLTVKNVTDENMKEFKITNELGNDLSGYYDKPVFDKEKNTVTIKKFSDFVNGDKIYFTIDKGEKYEHTVIIGAIAKIVLEGPSRVVVGVKTKMNIKFLDQNNVELTAPSSVYLKKDGDAIVDLDGIYVTMWQAGQSIKLDVVYEMGWDTTTWTQKVMNAVAPITVTCVDAMDATAKGMKFNLEDKDYREAGSNAPLLICENDMDKKLYVSVDVTDGDPMKSSDAAYTYNFKYEPLDTNILIVDGLGNLVPLKVGTARVLVSFEYGNVKSTSSVYVTVRPKRVVSSVTVDGNNNHVSISSTSGIEKKTVTFTTRDQYNEKFGDGKVQDVKLIDGNAAPSWCKWDTSKNGNWVSFEGDNQKAGIYNFRVYFADNVSTVISVTVNTSTVADLDIAKAASFRIVPVTGKDYNQTVNVKDATDNSSLVYEFRIVAVDQRGTAYAVVDQTTIDATNMVKVGNTSKTPVFDSTNKTWKIEMSSSVSTGSAVTTPSAVTIDPKVNCIIKGSQYTVIEDKITIGTTNNRVTIGSKVYPLLALNGSFQMDHGDAKLGVKDNNFKVTTSAGKDTIKNAIMAQLTVDTDKGFAVTGIELQNENNINFDRSTNVYVTKVTVSHTLEGGNVVYQTISFGKLFYVEVQ